MPLIRRLALFGCSLVLLAGVALVVLTFGATLLWAVPLAGAFLVCAVAIQRWRENDLLRRFRLDFGPTKDLLVVYTASPHWQPRIEEEWLKRWGTRAVVLNRSKPWHPDQIEARLWRAMGGLFEHTPVAIVIPPRGRPTVVRFFTAFRDFKHGKPARLLAAEELLRKALESTPSHAAA